MPYTVGIIADTHIPDRVSDLHPRIMPILREAGAAHILHAGDIASDRVLEELSQVAPVTAVRGNRDFLVRELNLVEELEFGGVPVALLHGHGGMIRYLWDKWQYIVFGYRLKRYLKLLTHASPRAKVVVFGHTHYPVVTEHAGKVLFNPGSASFGFRRTEWPSVGLLRVRDNQQFDCQIIKLEGYRIQQRKWVAVEDGPAALPKSR